MYRAKPITQRDGSKLASENCRMASIATGLDFDTVGAKTSTGAKMRASQPDQSGGTDSGDAVIAWQRHGETLSVRDGRTFDDALTDLKNGHLIHLDVWHASAGGPCLSGTGRYGHTMAVAPEKNGTRWLVSDPWCLPANWQWWEESKLRAGAEKWGGMVYNRATGGGGDGSLREAVLFLLSLGTPEHPADEDPDDTGGAGRILYTRTAAHPVAPTPPSGGTATVGILFDMRQYQLAKDLPVYLDTTGAVKVTTIKAGGKVSVLGYKAVKDENGADSAWSAVRVTTGGLASDPAIGNQNAILWVKKADLPTSPLATPLDWDSGVWALMGQPDGVYPCPPGPTPVPGDCAEEVVRAVAARDEAWREWLLAGAPGRDET